MTDDTQANPQANSPGEAPTNHTKTPDNPPFSASSALPDEILDAMTRAALERLGQTFLDVAAGLREVAAEVTGCEAVDERIAARRGAELREALR